MYKCNNCGKAIRWSEFAGWIHGRNGEGYEENCNDGTDNKAQVRPEDMEWLHK